MCAPYSTCTNTVGDYSCECCYSDEGYQGISGFGYIGDGKDRCYADSILRFNDSDSQAVFFGSITDKADPPVHIQVPGGFPYFGKLYYDIYVHMNGLITFDTENAPYLGTSFMQTNPTYNHVTFIAPFWTDLEPASTISIGKTGVYVDGYVSYPLGAGRSNIHNFPKTRGWIQEIEDQFGDHFQPTMIITATWSNMMASPASSFNAEHERARITFQTVLVTDGARSFGFNSYAESPQDSDWNVPLSNVFIGLKDDENVEIIRALEFEDLFTDPVQPPCESMTFLTQRGRRYRNFTPQDAQTNNNTACLAEASRQFNEHKGFGVLSSDESGSLPPELVCPCLESQAIADNRFVPVHLEEPTADRRSCHLSRFFTEIAVHSPDKDDYDARAYCCYDS